MAELNAEYERQAKLDLAKIVASDSKCIAQLKEQNRALQRNNTELVLRVRELERQLKNGGKKNGD